MARMRSQNRRPASPPHRGRFGRRAEQAQPGRRFARGAQQTAPARRFGRPARPSAGAGKRGRQPQPGGLQRLVHQVRGALPGASSGKRGSRSRSPIAPVRDLLTSIGGKKGAGTSRGRRPAMLGLLGAGAAGAAVVAKRRKASAPSETPPTATEAVSEPHPATTPAPRPDTQEAGDHSR